MSFGSLFWPSEPAKVWAFIDVLLEKKIPFVSYVLSGKALQAYLKSY